jgi:hypothetical protein
LGLIDIAADPLNSSEHILLSNILLGAWRDNRDVTLADLIRGTQDPPFSSIGVLPVDDVVSKNERRKLATSLNNVIASPSFAPWLQGEALSIPTLLRNPSGHPQAAIINISHLSDSERMFAITLILNEVVGWLRTLEGTGALRAVLYIDEVFGMMPPTANPPSKKPLLTLLKQARAYGLGVVLSTQNPVDLDYKGLSNTGTWFIGRLQTPQDRDRVLDGLATASGAGPNRAELRDTLGSLGKRVFLAHNIHEEAPAVFRTRWVMSYLAGPLSRLQLERMTPEPSTRPSSARPPTTPSVTANDHAAAIPEDVPQYHLPAPAGQVATYFAHALAIADIRYQQSKFDLDHTARIITVAEIHAGAVTVPWSLGRVLLEPAETLAPGPPSTGTRVSPPTTISHKDPSEWEKSYRHHATQAPLKLYRHDASNSTSTPNETLEEFTDRVNVYQRELRDEKKSELSDRAKKRIATLEERAHRALAALEKERGQSRQRQLDAAINVGNAILGAVLGGRRRSLSSTMSSLNRAGKERSDVLGAQKELAAIQAAIASAQEELRDQIDDIRIKEPVVTTVDVRPKSTHVLIHNTAVVWLPHARSERGYTPLFKIVGGGS